MSTLGVFLEMSYKQGTDVNETETISVNSRYLIFEVT